MSGPRNLIVLTAAVVVACAVAVLLWGQSGHPDDGSDRSPASADATLDLERVVATMGQPRPQRLAYWLHDLGVDPADDTAVRRALGAALPGGQESDRTLRAVEAQNRELRALVQRADDALAPAADEHRRQEDLQARVTDRQTAVTRGTSDLERSLGRLPATLRRLGPTTTDLQDLATAAVPTVNDLRRGAPAMGRALKRLRTFSTAAKTPLQDLGLTAQQAQSVLKDATPVLGRVSDLTAAAAPVGRSAAALTRSLGQTGGFERILDYVFAQTLAVNAYDDDGHYLRTRLVLSPCSVATRQATAGCATHRHAAMPQATAKPASADRALETTLLRRVLRETPPSEAFARSSDRPGYRTLRRRIARGDRRRSTARKRVAKQALTAGTSSASARGQDDPITVDGGLLPGATPKGDG